MKCKGIKDPKKCLQCPYPDCIADEFGNLPQYAVDKIEKNRQSCKEYYERHKEELKAKRQTPEAKKKIRERAVQWRLNNPEKYKEQVRKYNKKNRKRRKEINAEYYEKHREERCAKMREYYWRKKGEALRGY